MEPGVHARTAILMALIQGKGFGLELIDRVKDRTKGKIALHQGSVYPLLRAMEDEGLLKSWDDEPSDVRAGRPRRYYELTAEGLRAAREQSKTLAGLLKFAEVL